MPSARPSIVPASIALPLLSLCHWFACCPAIVRAACSEPLQACWISDGEGQIPSTSPFPMQAKGTDKVQPLQ